MKEAFINGVETIQEIPKLERLRRLQSYEALLDSCNISNMVKKWSRPQQLKTTGGVRTGNFKTLTRKS